MCVLKKSCTLRRSNRTPWEKGLAGLTKRDIQLIIDGGFQTVESVAYTPRRTLEQVKGISEQKAAKILAEGLFFSPRFSLDRLGN